MIFTVTAYPLYKIFLIHERQYFFTLFIFGFYFIVLTWVIILCISQSTDNPCNQPLMTRYIIVIKGSVKEEKECLCFVFIHYAVDFLCYGIYFFLKKPFLLGETQRFFYIFNMSWLKPKYTLYFHSIYRGDTYLLTYFSFNYLFQFTTVLILKERI